MPNYFLYMSPEPAFREMYVNAADAYNNTPYSQRNSGFDLFCNPVDADLDYSDHAVLVGQGCKVVATDMSRNIAFWLAPRSSISRTQFRLANSLGLIDATYRGTIKAAFNRIQNNGPLPEYGQRLCQLAVADLTPWSRIVIVDELPGPDTARGAGGFGSTG
jgi:dUTP pyrophosphatase